MLGRSKTFKSPCFRIENLRWRNIARPLCLSGRVFKGNQNPDAWSPGKRPFHNRLTMTTLIQTSSATIKGKKTKDEMEGDSKNDWLEMSWAHILMGIWTPHCCCWKASATILASPPCSYWANQTQFRPALDSCPTKAAAGEREMEFPSRTTGWLNGREAPAPGSVGQLPNTILLQHHAGAKANSKACWAGWRAV